MNEEAREPAPDGDEKAEKAELGEPEHEAADVEQGALEERREERPDLDERERRISPERKPMGPPLDEPDEGAGPPVEEEAREAPEESPTDPSES